jgi:aryl-alcohol dehydrogenase-like predicted oxidoreductase
MSDSTIPTRTLGRQGLVVSALGLRCMGMSQSYGPADERESIATIHRAIELGMFFLYTANVYGDGHNERLVGRAISDRREKEILATKFGLHRDDGSMRTSGRPEYVKACCDESLARLGVEHIDLYYHHRVDPDVPIEETVGAIAELVQAGKVRYLGLSEASVDSLERATATHPITALQNEWSLWSRDLEDAVLPVARRLGIGMVPYSPLGRGFLTGPLPARTTSHPTIFDVPVRAFNERTSNAIWTSSPRYAAWPMRNTSRRDSSPSPGYWHRARTWYPFLGPRSARNLSRTRRTAL